MMWSSVFFLLYMRATCSISAFSALLQQPLKFYLSLKLTLTLSFTYALPASGSLPLKSDLVEVALLSF